MPAVNRQLDIIIRINQYTFLLFAVDGRGLPFHLFMTCLLPTLQALRRPSHGLVDCGNACRETCVPHLLSSGPRSLCL